MKRKAIGNIKIPFIIFTLFAMLILNSCLNPFAPTREYSDTDHSLLGDQTTLEGFFQNFKYAYNFKDTLAYSDLLDENFTFSYTNYDKNVELSWTREEDMLTTSRLFLAAQNLDLVWNEIVLNEGDSVLRMVSRSFNLTITFDYSDIIRLYGKAVFKLQRPDTLSNWKLVLWRDESSY